MRRISASIGVFRGALLADAVGLGKTYVALAIAARYRSTVVVVPASLVSQWLRVSARVGVPIQTITHEALSRGSSVPDADLLVVDEAHRFRNPNTRRYEQLSRFRNQSCLLLLTATPVVNRASDLVHLLRLFLSDCAFSLFGLSSMDDAVAKRDYALIARTASAAIVARSVESIESLSGLLPHVRDGTVIRAGSINDSTLNPLLRLVDALQLPNAGASQDYPLLRLHLMHRLASSAIAFRDTVRRHLSYTEHSLSAVERGECLPRSIARRIFSTECELQFALGDLFQSSSNKTTPLVALRADQESLYQILNLLANTIGSSPKAEALAQIIRNRIGRKTIIFTTAVATALDLARRLGWKELAVVGAGRGWIASGQIPVDEALALFAPNSRGRPAPHRSMNVSTLIATDLASEGLDLQDADAVVHYDLPWTPLKLEQRVGRIARLGSAFQTSDVHWFAPPEILDRRLRLQTRISNKVTDQIGLNVAATSNVGRARIVNEVLVRRERIGRHSRAKSPQKPCFAVVRGPLCASVAVLWTVGNSRIPELLSIGSHPPREILDITTSDEILKALLIAPESRADPPQPLIDRLLTVLRGRLATYDMGAGDPHTRRLARRVLRRAYAAGRKRELKLLTTLDDVLNRLRQGLSVGGERSLSELLYGKHSYLAIRDWLGEQPEVKADYPTFEIAAALFGDGSTVQHGEQI